jgi:hypothetical protein
VEQAEMGTTPNRIRAGPFPELDERDLAHLVSERRLAGASLDDPQPKHLLIVPDGPVQVRHLKPYPAEMRLSGQAGAFGWHEAAPYRWVRP